tara:strand:- start:33994 stop:34332 length:339 start_codon:yes stop_codon:yes gene_type:complete
MIFICCRAKPKVFTFNRIHQNGLIFLGKMLIRTKSCCSDTFLIGDAVQFLMPKLKSGMRMKLENMISLETDGAGINSRIKVVDGDLEQSSLSIILFAQRTIIFMSSARAGKY